MEKLLPIKFFEKRKIDEQFTEAGRNNEPPKWLLKDDALAIRSQHLTSGLFRVAANFEMYKKEGHVLPMVMTTTVTEEALAKTHRKAIVDLLNSDSNSNVIGIEPVRKKKSSCTDGEGSQIESKAEKTKEIRKLMSIVTTDQLISNINKVLQDTHGSAKLISSISDIQPFEAWSGDYNPNNKAYHVMLVDYQDSHRNKLAQVLFRKQCVDHEITINRETRYSSDMRLYRITLDSLSDMELVRGFEGVQSIEEAIPIHVELDFFEDMPLPSPKQPVDGKAYPIVGVLDSGVQKNNYLAPWLLGQSEEYYESRLQDKNHGSMVASILEYSDELNGTDYFATDGVMMLEAVITPDLRKETVYPEDLIDNVRDAIERHPNIKIWTMSVGTNEECDPDVFSEYGMALDNIEDENHVLIVKSVGNTTAFMKRKDERVAKMADSVRSLVVGSIANEKGRFDIAEINMPSPFTRMGPGPSYIIKPDLVAYGGNAGIRPDGNMTTTGVKTFDLFGSPTRAPGTSFSTPWIARIAAELNFLLDGDFDPLLIKALMIHNAGYPAGDKMTMVDKKKYMGFGMPRGTGDILYNSENEITLVLRDTLQKGTFIDILDFPFSESLIGTDGRYHGQITVTLVSSPILRSSQAAEYCQSNINVAFGTMEAIMERDTTKRTVRNPYGAKDAKNIIQDSLYSSKVFDVLEGRAFGRERTLLKLGQKFYPVKKYAVNLDEMTAANRRKFLDGSRKWYMKVEGLFRDAIEREARADGKVLEQEFCVLLTIRDPEGKAPVYNEITQQLQQKGFVYSNVRLKNEIREHVHIEGESIG
ncbi:S8 family peptidase [Megasphaera elsdenii]|jgi:hypothetical protein|uniref:S8 family peptidase n=1 Tax=Megasphaera elsdenii TaxID=907 RepID=UPI00242BD77D|nr:S8 family peptidase [Megasphaera elsdenii]